MNQAERGLMSIGGVLLFFGVILLVVGGIMKSKKSKLSEDGKTYYNPETSEVYKTDPQKTGKNLLIAGGVLLGVGVVLMFIGARK